MPKPYLTQEQIEAATAKEWRKVENSQYPNLTGPKTEAGKRRALRNLRPGAHTFEHGYHSPGMKHGGYINRILTLDEQSVYNEWKEKYLDDFDLNSSSDAAILENVLMEHVIQYRLMVRKAEKPSLDIDRALSESQKRLRENLEALGTLRKQRVAIRDETTENIASVILAFTKEQQRIFALEQEKRDEEQRMLEAKKQRDTHIVDADFEIDTENNDTVSREDEKMGQE